jgi:hypothetical protein
MDTGPGKLVGINFNQKTGNMSVAWTANDKTQGFLTLIGPVDHRGLVSSNILSTITNPTKLDPGPIGANYKEQVQWRDAATVKLLAASDFFSPWARLPGPFLLSPGYGGLLYEPLHDGHIIALKVLPSANSTSPSPPLTSTNSTSSTN